MQLRRLAVIQNIVKIPIKPIKICLFLWRLPKWCHPLSSSWLLCYWCLLAWQPHRLKRKKTQNHYWRVGPCQVQKALIQLNSKRWGICKSITITTTGCRGGCLSSARPYSHGVGIATSCSCCSPLESIIREHRVPGCGGKTVLVRLPEAKRCACRPCINGR